MSYILVTNDDGVRAPGIVALASAMRALGEVRVIAPATNQSASGHSNPCSRASRSPKPGMPVTETGNMLVRPVQHEAFAGYRAYPCGGLPVMSDFLLLMSNIQLKLIFQILSLGLCAFLAYLARIKRQRLRTLFPEWILRLIYLFLVIQILLLVINVSSNIPGPTCFRQSMAPGPGEKHPVDCVYDSIVAAGHPVPCHWHHFSEDFLGRAPVLARPLPRHHHHCPDRIRNSAQTFVPTLSPGIVPALRTVRDGGNPDHDHATARANDVCCCPCCWAVWGYGAWARSSSTIFVSTIPLQQ